MTLSGATHGDYVVILHSIYMNPDLDQDQRSTADIDLDSPTPCYFSTLAIWEVISNSYVMI